MHMHAPMAAILPNLGLDPNMDLDGCIYAFFLLINRILSPDVKLCNMSMTTQQGHAAFDYSELMSDHYPRQQG